MLRFAVPFHISNYTELQANDFKKVAESGWEKKHIIQGEKDLYDYITDLVGEGENNSIASSWKLPKEHFHRDRFLSEVSQKEMSWKFKEIGLLIFHDGIGILWYEIDACSIVDMEDFLDFAYSLKELSRGDNEKNYSLINIPVSGKEDVQYKVLEQDKNIEVLELKETKQGMIAVCKKKIQLYRDVLSKYISCISIDSFFSNRKKEGIILPDRGIAFSWIYEIVDEKNNIKAHDLAFHLGRNYKSSYEMATNYREQDFYEPFDDSIWYGSLEGCGNYTGPTRQKEFYNSGYEQRLNTYYYIYILCLGQYYSLLQLAQDISTLPTDDRMYSTRSNILEKMLDKIHIFNLKNNYSQVGHLTQHNEFYDYLQSKLGINKMQQELEVELQSLYEMVDRKQAIRNAERYKILTILSGIFVLIQTLVGVADLYDSFKMNEWDRFAFGLGGIFASAFVAILVLLIGKILNKVSESIDRKKRKL